jgi:hypothetical protein
MLGKGLRTTISPWLARLADRGAGVGVEDVDVDAEGLHLHLAGA